MENPIEYINRQICEEFSKHSKILMEDKQNYSLHTLRLNPIICEEISSLEKNTPEEKLYAALAGLIVTSTHPFAVTDQDCLKKTLLAYQQINPLLKEKEIKDLAKYHSEATKANLTRLRAMSRKSPFERNFTTSSL